MKTNNKEKTEKIVIQQMLDDKKAIREYIKKHGTLKGFKSDSIKLAKPF